MAAFGFVFTSILILIAMLNGPHCQRSVYAFEKNESDYMRDCQPAANPISVILLTYHRSGSSYVAELLATQRNASYFFEPLFYSDYRIRIRTPEFRRDYLRRLLECDSLVLDTLRGQDEVIIVRKFLDTWNKFQTTNYSSEAVARYCRCSPVRVIKTIRLRLEEALPMLDTMPGLRIVNLVRDPRARYASVVAPGGSWAQRDRTVQRICSDMANDTAIARRMLGSDKYLRVRYEDVVADPTGQVRAIYQHLLGDDVTLDGRRQNMSNTDPNDYYSTYRLSTFDPNHWRQTLNKSTIELVQAECGSLIKELGYGLIT